MADFDDLMRQGRDGHATITPDWGQGRATFGGLLGAMAHEAMVRRLSDDRPLRSLAISFIAPAAPDGDVTVEAEILRQGKAVTQVESRLYQNDQVVLVALGSFGVSRDSVIAVEPESAPDVKDPDAAHPMPQMEGVTPDFLCHYDLRFALGGFPFTGSTDRTMGGWMRFREPLQATSDDAACFRRITCGMGRVPRTLRGTIAALFYSSFFVGFFEEVTVD